MTAHLRLAGGTGTGSHWLAPAVQMAAVASGNWPLPAEPGAAGWACFPRTATRTPIPDARSVRAGRDFAVATLHRWGAAERCEDIAVVVSELLTNALRHALPDAGQTQPRYPVRLGLLQPGRCVLCAVADPSPRAPAPEEPGTLAETGRGLRVIGALADTWGYTPPSHIGKVVWALFCLSRPRSALPGPGSRTIRVAEAAAHTAGEDWERAPGQALAGSDGPGAGTGGQDYVRNHGAPRGWW